MTWLFCGISRNTVTIKCLFFCTICERRFTAIVMSLFSLSHCCNVFTSITIRNWCFEFLSPLTNINQRIKSKNQCTTNLKQYLIIGELDFFYFSYKTVALSQWFNRPIFLCKFHVKLCLHPCPIEICSFSLQILWSVNSKVYCFQAIFFKIQIISTSWILHKFLNIFFIIIYLQNSITS
jgi:hypothetical protein